MLALTYISYLELELKKNLLYWRLLRSKNEKLLKI